jgi:hypothetical protein
MSQPPLGGKIFSSAKRFAANHQRVKFSSFFDDSPAPLAENT